jgi:hypothetical protein
MTTLSFNSSFHMYTIRENDKEWTTGEQANFSDQTLRKQKQDLRSYPVLCNASSNRGRIKLGNGFIPLEHMDSYNWGDWRLGSYHWILGVIEGMSRSLLLRAETVRP